MRHFSSELSRGLCLAVVATLLLTSAAALAVQAKPILPVIMDGQSSSGSANTGSASKGPAKTTDPITGEFNKYPGLREELGRLITRFKQELKMPAARGQSRLLPLLPGSTTFYLALPNYGDTLHQALTIFQEERKLSAPLNDWWQHNMAKEGPELESNLDKFYQLSQFMGEEIVISGGENGKDGELLFLAEVKKPGLKAFLAKLDKDLSSKSSSSLLIFDPQTLPATVPAGSKDKLLVLVRPDFLVMASSLPALTQVNKQLDLRGGRFASTPFGARLNRSYENSAEILAGVDLQRLLRAFSKETKPFAQILEASGFSDAKFLIWEQGDSAGQAPNHAELSFTGPRRSIASWLASPGHMGGLDFVSVNSPMAFAFRLKSPALMFDDLKAMDAASGANSMASLNQMETALNINLRDALLNKLTGEMVFDVDSSDPQNPVWKVVLGANDPDGLMQTVDLLLTATNAKPKSYMEDGVTFHTLPAPGGPKMQDLNYAMVDGYLIAASSHDSLAAAISTHRSGDSLGRSNKLRESMPQGYPVEASALLYSNMGMRLEQMMRQFSPESAQFFSKVMAGQPSVGAMYGEETVIRQASNSNGMSVGAIMVIAAIAVPNLLRSRIAANEASAVSSMRVINTAQVTYWTAYPNRGFASDLATLGPGDGDCSDSKYISDKHACLLNDVLGGVSCTAGVWCTHAGYRFMVTTSCQSGICQEFVALATPANTNGGTRNYCSVSDAVVRTRSGPPLTGPISAAECRRWAPVR